MKNILDLQLNPKKEGQHEDMIEDDFKDLEEKDEDNFKMSPMRHFSVMEDPNPGNNII